MSGLNFTAIDFETANGSRASACSVGLVRVVDGKVVGTARSLIRPHVEHAQFAPHNVKVHGITAKQVVDAPTWDQLLLPVMAFIDGSPLVAHNSPFDRSVFEAVTAAHGLTATTPDFLCSLQLAQERMQLIDYKLPTVAGSLGVPLTDHHDATADAMACAGVVLKLARLFEQDTLEELWAAIPAPAAAATRSQPRHWTSKKLSDLPQAATDADATHPLYGQVAVFTGNLTSMERDDAMAAVARHGASIGNSVTKKTTLLVAAATGTGKEKKAREYIAAGQAIEIITEQQFISLIS